MIIWCENFPVEIEELHNNEQQPAKRTPERELMSCMLHLHIDIISVFFDQLIKICIAYVARNIGSK